MFFKKEIFVLLCVFTISIFAQNNVVKIWPNFAPGTEGKTNEEYFEDGRYKKVYQPDLAIFLPEKQNENKTAILILPGGGYTHLAFEKEGIKIAKRFNEEGITAFVLKYRLSVEEALADAQRALSFIRCNFQKYNINPDNIGVIGFSAGGHLAANLISHPTRNTFLDVVDSTGCSPNFAIIVYGWLQDQYDFFSKNNPPTILFHAGDDTRVPVEQSINYFNALLKKGIQTEMHIYESGGHGFGLGLEKGNTGNWTKVCCDWMRQRNIIK
jgi:acetyl esterase/lipase